MAELHDLSALEQGEALRRGEVGPVELVEHYLARIEAHAPDLGAFVTVTAARARAAAAEAAAVLSARATGPAVRPGAAGLLEGVPVAIKDLTLTAGVRTTFGSAAFADFVPGLDADVVALLRDAGLISVGKTTTSEFGLSLYSESDVAPPARNPWSPGHTAGGSSGGAAAAVAAGLVPFAQGNDGGGSLRIPASICGVVGFKPSRGLVSGGPLGFGAFGLTTNGPIARTVADAAALLDVLSVPVAGEPFPSPGRPAAGFLDAARHPEAYLPAGRPLRIGRYVATAVPDATPSPEVLAVCDDAAATFVALGCEVVDVAPPFPLDATGQFETVWSVLALSPVPPDREALLRPLTRWLRERGRAVAVENLLLALADLQVRTRRHARTPPICDLYLSPVLAAAQAPLDWFSSAPDPAEDFARQVRFSPYCAAYNVTGQPAVSLPVGADQQGAPIGVMLAAAVGADALLVSASAWFESALPWAHRHPPIWSTAGVPLP